jgi:carbon monoxide dehydrogenase subunit G
MIEVEQSVPVNVAIGAVWHYVKDMQKWASMMPGYRECTVIDATDSRWTLKVGVGGLVRTVNVLVHVEEWIEPERVNFSYKLEGDPVQGSGSYSASRKRDQETDVALRIRVVGSGPMAPMWEAMSRPLLPQLAKSFAEKLKVEIESAGGAPGSQGATIETPSLPAAIRKWLRNLWRAMFGPRLTTRD